VPASCRILGHTSSMLAMYRPPERKLKD